MPSTRRQATSNIIGSEGQDIPEPDGWKERKKEMKIIDNHSSIVSN